MMNTDIKARWVARLRSGQDKQGRGMLRNERDAMCCLGVKCEIAVEDGIIPPAFLDEDRYYYGESAHDSGVPPQVVTDWAGLVAQNPFIELPGADGEVYGVTLAELNDGGMTFAQIADVIEYFL